MSADQGQFDFDAPIARASDPAPSHRAAEATGAKLAGLRQIAHTRAVELCQQYGDATASEIGRAMENVDDMARCESIRKRVGELVKAGLLVYAGERICRKTGSKVSAFKVKA